MSKGNVEMQGPSKSSQLGEICLGDVAIIGEYLQAVFFLTRIDLFDIDGVLGIYTVFTVFGQPFGGFYTSNCVQSLRRSREMLVTVHPHTLDDSGTPKSHGLASFSITFPVYNGNLGGFSLFETKPVRSCLELRVSAEVNVRGMMHRFERSDLARILNSR